MQRDKPDVSSRKYDDNLRDCVKIALTKGSARGHEFHKMRQAIVAEHLQLGYDPSEIKDILSEWNKKCEKPISVADEKNYLHKYVDWVKAKNGKTGCKALEDYCIGKESCQFHFKVTCKNRQDTKDLPFDRKELENFLTERFKADGYVMMLVVNALRYIQMEKATGELILIGFRSISSVIRDKYGHYIDPMTIFRKISLLIEEGVIQRVVKGKAGNFNKQANGYRFLAWKRPSGETILPKVTDMCNASVPIMSNTRYS